MRQSLATLFLAELNYLEVERYSRADPSFSDKSIELAFVEYNWVVSIRLQMRMNFEHLCLANMITPDRGVTATKCDPNL